MSAKDKAKELVRKYWDLGGIDVLEVKQCAIIVVDEIIEECYKWSGGDNNTWDRERFNFWTEVKHEIENL
jgi:hypothetical protein